MLSIDLIRQNLKRSEVIVLSKIEDMKEHGMILSTPIGGCHTLWVLGHFAVFESPVIKHFLFENQTYWLIK